MTLGSASRSPEYDRLNVVSHLVCQVLFRRSDGSVDMDLCELVLELGGYEAETVEAAEPGVACAAVLKRLRAGFAALFERPEVWRAGMLVRLALGAGSAGVSATNELWRRDDTGSVETAIEFERQLRQLEVLLGQVAGGDQEEGSAATADG